MRKFFGAIIIIAASLFTTACDELIDPLTCDGCDSTTPWSHPDASSCYGTEADCESATGLDCVICT